MPYADPAKKQEYMARYNSEYYEQKREVIIPRVNINKNKLRKEKKEWCLHSTTGHCILLTHYLYFVVCPNSVIL